jgi:hypothetical protein
MIRITQQDLLDFIQAQPDDRPVDMNENKSADHCGCLAVQYMRSNHPDVKFNFASICGVATETERVAHSDIRFADFVPTGVFTWKGTYGQIKKFLRL